MAFGPAEEYDFATRWRPARAALLLFLSLGLLWVSENFPVGQVFEPQGLAWRLWVSYAKDLLQPFAFYLFLCLGERWLAPWQARAALAFGVPTLLEIGQAMFYRLFSGYYMGAFDPLDIVMYAFGVGLGVLFERGWSLCIFAPKKFLKG